MLIINSKVPKYHCFTERLQWLRFHEKRQYPYRYFQLWKMIKEFCLLMLITMVYIFITVKGKHSSLGLNMHATISFAAPTHTGDARYSSRAILSIFRIFQHLDKVPVHLSVSRLKFCNIVHKVFVSLGTPALLSCPIQSMRRHHFCQVRKTSIQLGTNGPSH